MARAIALGLLLLAACAHRDAQHEVQRDPAPLRRRLSLPAALDDVRWMVTTLPDASARLTVPGPTDYVDIYAYIEVPSASWSTLSQGAPATLTLPSSVTAILPDGAGPKVAGPAVAIAPIGDAVTVEGAVRVGDGLIVACRERLGS